MKPRRADEREPRSERVAGEIGAAISRVRRLLWSKADQRLSVHGGSMLTWTVLDNLERYGPRSQSEIALAIAQHPTGLSRLLDELELAAFVSRSRDKADRRRVLVQITRRGRTRLTAGRSAVIAAVEEGLGPLDQRERAVLSGLLAKLLLPAT